MSAQLAGFFLDLSWHDGLEEMPAGRYRLEAKILLEKERKAREERLRHIEGLKAMVKEYGPICEKGLHLDEKYLRGVLFRQDLHEKRSFR